MEKGAPMLAHLTPWHPMHTIINMIDPMICHATDFILRTASRLDLLMIGYLLNHAVFQHEFPLGSEADNNDKYGNYIGVILTVLIITKLTINIHNFMNATSRVRIHDMVMIDGRRYHRSRSVLLRILPANIAEKITPPVNYQDLDYGNSMIFTRLGDFQNKDFDSNNFKIFQQLNYPWYHNWYALCYQSSYTTSHYNMDLKFKHVKVQCLTSSNFMYEHKLSMTFYGSTREYGTTLHYLDDPNLDGVEITHKYHLLKIKYVDNIPNIPIIRNVIIQPNTTEKNHYHYNHYEGMDLMPLSFPSGYVCRGTIWLGNIRTTAVFDTGSAQNVISQQMRDRLYGTDVILNVLEVTPMSCRSVFGQTVMVNEMAVLDLQLAGLQANAHDAQMVSFTVCCCILQGAFEDMILGKPTLDSLGFYSDNQGIELTNLDIRIPLLRPSVIRDITSPSTMTPRTPETIEEYDSNSEPIMVLIHGTPTFGPSENHDDDNGILYDHPDDVNNNEYLTSSTDPYSEESLAEPWGYDWEYDYHHQGFDQESDRDHHDHHTNDNEEDINNNETGDPDPQNNDPTDNVSDVDPPSYTPDEDLIIMSAEEYNQVYNSPDDGTPRPNPDGQNLMDDDSDSSEIPALETPPTPWDTYATSAWEDDVQHGDNRPYNHYGGGDYPPNHPYHPDHPDHQYHESLVHFTLRIHHYQQVGIIFRFRQVPPGRHAIRKLYFIRNQRGSRVAPLYPVLPGQRVESIILHFTSNHINDICCLLFDDYFNLDNYQATYLSEDDAELDENQIPFRWIDTREVIREWGDLHYGLVVIGIEMITGIPTHQFYITSRGHHLQNRPMHYVQEQLVDLRGRMPRGVQGPGPGQEGTLKIPPAWGPEMADQYPFRTWATDMQLWASATELSPTQQGPAAALRLTGLARAYAREIPPQDLTHGTVLDLEDGNGLQQVSGVALLIRGLSRRFGPLEVETSINAIAAMMAFRKESGETMDQFLARFELTRHRA